MLGLGFAVGVGDTLGMTDVVDDLGALELGNAVDELVCVEVDVPIVLVGEGAIVSERLRMEKINDSMKLMLTRTLLHKTS